MCVVRGRGDHEGRVGKVCGEGVENVCLMVKEIAWVVEEVRVCAMCGEGNVCEMCALSEIGGVWWEDVCVTPASLKPLEAGLRDWCIYYMI